jgi:hypothetical protein
MMTVVRFISSLSCACHARALVNTCARKNLDFRCLDRRLYPPGSDYFTCQGSRCDSHDVIDDAHDAHEAHRIVDGAAHAKSPKKPDWPTG